MIFHLKESYFLLIGGNRNAGKIMQSILFLLGSAHRKRWRKTCTRHTCSKQYTDHLRQKTMEELSEKCNGNRWLSFRQRMRRRLLLICVVADANPERFICLVVSWVSSDGWLDCRQHVQSNSFSSSLRSISPEHGVAADSNNAVRMFRLEVRFSDDGGVNVVAIQISGQVVNCMRLRQSGGVQNVQRRRW